MEEEDLILQQSFFIFLQTRVWKATPLDVGWKAQ